MAAVVRAAPTLTKAAPVAVAAPARVSPVSLAGPRLALGGGAPIPTPTRARLESSLGANLSGVRVHSGPGAATAASNLNARAFAYGPQIVLGAGQRADDLGLMGHEVAHVLQQQDNPTPQRLAAGNAPRPATARGFAGPAVLLGGPLSVPHHSGGVLQRWTPYSSDRYEGEANRASAAVVRGEPFAVTERTGSPRVQPFLGIDIDIVGRALDYIAPKANAIPGFRMFTVVLGVNPINMSPVDRSPANVIRAVIEFMPGGALITQALDSHGLIDKIGGWVGEQIKSLGLIGGSIKESLVAFAKSLGVKDLGDLGGVWERAKQIFTQPIDRIKSFVAGLVTDIVKFIKDAILMPLAKLAEKTSGWDLLIAVLGKNPITGEPVPRTAETLIPGFLKLIGQQEVWENMKKANALGRAWAWFQDAMAAVTGFVNEIPALALATFKSLEIADIILVPRAFAKVGAVFGNFLGRFTDWAGTAVWNLLEIVFDSVSPGAFDYVKRTGAALKSILKNPLPFVGYLVQAAKLGFQNFAGNFGTHFKAGLLGWLTGSLPGLYVPKAFSPLEIGKFVLSVLGVSWPQIRGKIVKALGPSGETIMTVAEAGVDVIVALVKGGPAAAWDVIKDKLTDLKDAVIGGITGMVVDFVVKTAIPKLIAMFIPGVGFIPAIISIYQTIQTFVAQMAKIAAVIKGFIDSIVAIAAGNIGAAAGKVESILAGLLSLAINFLAGAFGLGKVSDKVRGVIDTIRAKVDKALDTAIAWLMAKAKALFAKLGGGKKGGKDDRTEEQKTRDKLAAIAEAERAAPKKGFDEAEVRKQLGAIKARYKLLTLNLVIDAKKERTETVHFTATASAVVEGKKTDVGIVAPLKLVVLKPAFNSEKKDAEGKKLATTHEEFEAQVALQEFALNQLTVKVWRQNWDKFYGGAGGKGKRWGDKEAQADLEAARSAERARTRALWDKNNPGRPPAERDAFIAELFTLNTGTDYRAYPFLHQSRPSHGIEYVNPLYGKAILHAVDQGAGGGAETVGIGGARENYSIGGQWGKKGGRAIALKALLEAEIKAAGSTADDKAVDELKLNVQLPVERK